VLHSWLITVFVTRLTRRVPLVEQALHTLPDCLSSPPVFSGVHATRSLVLCLCFVDCCWSFRTFSFGHCVVCFSSIYGFWLPLWYLQTLFTHILCIKLKITFLQKKNPPKETKKTLLTQLYVMGSIVTRKWILNHFSNRGGLGPYNLFKPSAFY
jgi:hypothetical protein